MKEIDKKITVDEIEEMDIINLPFKYANNCLVYRVDDNKICFITNIDSKEPSVAEYYLKEDISQYEITFKGRSEKSTKNKLTKIENLDYGACFKFSIDSCHVITYMKTRQEIVRENDKVYTCVDLTNGNIVHLSTGTIVTPLEWVIIS